MRVRLGASAVIALLAGFGLWLADMAGLLPWPRVATQSLAGILLLVAVTRMAGDAGARTQRALGHAVAGVALTATAWFMAMAVASGNRATALLGLAHLGAAWLAASPTEDAGERRRGRILLAAAMSTTSLLAIAALPAAVRVPGSPLLPLVLAGTTAFGGILLARERALGLLACSLAGVITIVLAARLLADTASGFPPDAPPFTATAPVLAATALLGSIPAVVALAVRLPALARALAPDASPWKRAVVVWLTLPAVAALAVAAMAR